MKKKKKKKKKLGKTFFLKISASEDVPINCLY